MIEENNLKEEFAKDFPNTWGNMKKQIYTDLERPGVDNSIIKPKHYLLYMENDVERVGLEIDPMDYPKIAEMLGNFLIEKGFKVNIEKTKK